MVKIRPKKQSKLILLPWINYQLEKLQMLNEPEKSKRPSKKASKPTSVPKRKAIGFPPKITGNGRANSPPPRIIIHPCTPNPPASHSLSQMSGKLVKILRLLFNECFRGKSRGDRF